MVRHQPPYIEGNISVITLIEIRKGVSGGKVGELKKLMEEGFTIVGLG
jgi:hypothetical protein